MGTVNLFHKEYKGWKNCIELSNGIIELVATTDVGPRIIRFGFTGDKNHFCEREDQVGTTGGNDWKLYGGHRLWHSPENQPRTYELDNTEILWQKRGDGILLRQPIEPWTLIQKELEISLSKDKAEATVIHRLTNKGAWAVELSLWALSVMATGGKEILPQATKDTGLLPNRMLSLWPYTKLNDPRVYWGEKYITLCQDENATSPFKMGLPIEAGWAAYANHGQLYVKKFPFIEGAVYPDYAASSYETYTCDFMLEMETLSPLTLLQPGETIEHTEVWALHKDVTLPQTEKEIDEIILPLI